MQCLNISAGRRCDQAYGCERLSHLRAIGCTGGLRAATMCPAAYALGFGQGALRAATSFFKTTKTTFVNISLDWSDKPDIGFVNTIYGRIVCERTLPPVKPRKRSRRAELPAVVRHSRRRQRVAARLLLLCT